MAVVHLPQTNFTSGVLSKDRLRGRSDIKQYYNGASVLLNVLIHPQGGVYRRPGLLWLADYDDEEIVRPFVFDYSDDIQYILVFYPDNIDVWKEDVLVHTITSTGLTTAQIREMDVTQSANLMIFAHLDFQPKQLVRGANDTSWTLGNFANLTIPLFAFSLSVTQPAQTLTPSAVSGVISLTAGGGTVFSATSVGGYVSGNGGEARITKYISATKVEATVIVPFIDTSAIASGTWDLETGYENAWSVSRGWPRAVTFHADRLFFASTALLPNVFWASGVAVYNDFNDTRTNADNSFSFSVRGDSINTIRSMISGDNLVILCNDSEHYVDGDITPELTFKVKRQDNRGIRENVPPLFVDGVVMYADSLADVLREFSYNDLEGKYNTSNLNLLSGNIINSPTSISHQKPLDDVDSDYVHVINGDGTWATLNTMRKQEITGWTTGTTEGDVLYSASLNGQVYVVVEREVGGSQLKYFEKFDRTLFTDSAFLYDSTATDTITGLDHLEGFEVDIIADGKIHERRIVTGGGVTLDWGASQVEVGIPIPVQVTLLPPNRELPDGTMIGRIRRIVACTLGLTDTFGVEVDGWGVKFLRFGQFELGQTPPTFSGRKRVTLRGYSREPQINITQNIPASFHLTDVIMEVGV